MHETCFEYEKPYYYRWASRNFNEGILIKHRQMLSIIINILQANVKATQNV